MTYTENERSEIAQAFRNAIPHLRLSIGLGEVNKSLYICHAINYGNKISDNSFEEITEAAKLAKDIIESRVRTNGVSRTFASWLRFVGVDTRGKDNEVQIHRLAWLKMLIEEFES